MKPLQFAIAAATAAFIALPGAASYAAGPFAAFSGNYSGSGTITARDGNRERIRCRGGNTEAGNSLKLGLRCASDSYRFELTSDLTSQGGNLSGTWGEVTRNVSGTLTGRLSGGSIQATAQSSAFNALLTINAHGNRLNVVIQSPGSEISEVAITLSRAR